MQVRTVLVRRVMPVRIVMLVRTVLVRIVMQVRIVMLVRTVLSKESNASEDSNTSKSSIASKESNASMSQCPKFVGSMSHGVPESLGTMTRSP